jgi:hypothetical protein
MNMPSETVPPLTWARTNSKANLGNGWRSGDGYDERYTDSDLGRR